MAHRADINSLAAADRQTLVDLMLQYLTDAVVAAHMTIIHSGLELFTGHRVYIAGMEAFLSANGGGAFVPLPFWDPANPIPPEFNVVKPWDDSTPRPPLVNLNPNMPLLAEWDYPVVCDFESGADLGNAINGWHGSVHIAIGGSMASVMIASAAPIFWCWHAFVDHIYWNWQLCQVSCPHLVGDPLGLAKLKIQHAGLKVGCVTRLPRYVLPPERVPTPYPPPRPDPYLSSHPPSLPVHPDHHEYAGQKGPRQSPYDGGHHEHEHHEPHGEHREHSGHERPSDHHEHPSHGEHPGHKDPSGYQGHSSHEDVFRHPKPDYSHLLRGPIVISQSPAGDMPVCLGCVIDLVVVTE